MLVSVGYKYFLKYFFLGHLAPVQPLNPGAHDPRLYPNVKRSRRSHLSRSRPDALLLCLGVFGKFFFNRNLCLIFTPKKRTSKVGLSDEQISQYLEQLIQEAEYLMIDPLLAELRCLKVRINKRDVLLVWNEGGVIK